MYPTVRSPPQVTALPETHLTLFVLLAGVLGGLGLAIIVMVCCRFCLRKKKPLTRQHVVFSRSSERQHSRTRKYHSLDSSVSVDIETSWGLSDSTPSPRELKEFCPDDSSRTVPPYMSPRSLPDIPEFKTPEEERCHYKVQPKRAPEVVPSTSGRRRSSTGIQRQASVCLSDGEDDLVLSPPPAIHHQEERPFDQQRMPPTKQVAVVVHRSNGLTTNSSPDRNSSCSCRNSRGSQGSHSHHSSLDSGSTRTVVALADQVSFSNGENGGKVRPVREKTMDLEEYSYDRRHASRSLPLLRERSTSSLDMTLCGEGWEVGLPSPTGCCHEIPPVLREAESTELGILERALEHYQAKNRRSVGSGGHHEPRVKYNDTGSREEIRDDSLMVIASSSSSSSSEEILREQLEYERLRMQYRQLWELRATFEEEEDDELSDTLRLEEEVAEEEVGEQETPGHQTPGDDGSPVRPPLATPEPSSQATSFESNTEPCPESCAGGECETGKIYSDLLVLPTPESRRHSYTQRRFKREIAKLGENSFDSTESSTDATTSRASFESSTDSTGGESQTRRLQQMKADSGYKSMESNGKRAPKLSRKQKHCHQSTVEGESIEELDEMASSEGMGTSCEYSLDETQVSPEITVTKEEWVAMTNTPEGPTDPEEPARKRTKSAFKKRLQCLKEWNTTTSSSEVGSSCEVPDSKVSVFHRFFRSGTRPPRGLERLLIRDYSIDEKSDNLFREFSRPDLHYHVEGVRRQGSGAGGRLYHHRHHHHHRGRRDDEVTSKVLSPQLSIEEESGCSEEDCDDDEEDAGSPSARDRWTSEGSFAYLQEIPIIRLPEVD